MKNFVRLIKALSKAYIKQFLTSFKFYLSTALLMSSISLMTSEPQDQTLETYLNLIGILMIGLLIVEILFHMGLVVRHYIKKQKKVVKNDSIKL